MFQYFYLKIVLKYTQIEKRIPVFTHFLVNDSETDLKKKEEYFHLKNFIKSIMM